MSWVGSKAGAILLGTNSASVLLPNGERFTVRADDVSSVLEAVGDRWPKRKFGRLRSRATLWLSGGLAHAACVSLPAGLQNEAEAGVIAASALEQEFSTGKPWTVWLAPDWRIKPATFAAGMDEALLLQLVGWAKIHGLRWLSVRPWWALPLNEMRARPTQSALLSLQDEDALLVLPWTEGGPMTAHTYLPAPTQQEASVIVNRISAAQVPVLQERAQAQCLLAADMAAKPAYQWAAAA